MIRNRDFTTEAEFKFFASESTAWHVRCRSAHAMQLNHHFEPTPDQGEKDAQFSAGNNPPAEAEEHSKTPVASSSPDESSTATKSDLDALAYRSVLKQLIGRFRKHEQIPGDD
jgi:hypothetical protein